MFWLDRWRAQAHRRHRLTNPLHAAPQRVNLEPGQHRESSTSAGAGAYASQRASQRSKPRCDRKTGIYAFEREQAAEFAPEELQVFKKEARAWAYFEASAPSYRKVMTHWVISAKRTDTRARRLDQLMQASAEQRRILK